MSKTPACNWDGERWTQPDETPCNEDHCAMRGRCANHVQHEAGIITCPSCIRRVRKDVEAIVELWIRLLVFDVVIDGIESEAMNLAGVAASPAQYAEKRRRIAAAYDDQGWCDWPRLEAFRDDDPHHPYSVLARCAQALEDAGWVTQAAWDWTVVRAAETITRALDGGFPHGDEFESIAAEIAACRSHLEAVDHDSRTPDLGRPCPACVEAHGKGPRLRKRHSAHTGYAPGQTCPERVKATEEAERRAKVCPWPRVYLEAECEICDGTLDAWHCPDDPAHSWVDADYHHRVDADYVQVAEWLSSADMIARTGVTRGSLTGWASQGHVAKRVGDGRVVYRVADVVRRLDKSTGAA